MSDNNNFFLKILFIVAPIIFALIIWGYDFLTTENSYLVSLMIGMSVTTIYYFIVSIFFIYWNRNKK